MHYIRRHIELLFFLIIGDINFDLFVKMGEKQFKVWVSPLATVFSDPIPLNEGDDMSIDRKSITVSVGFNFFHDFYFDHLTVLSSINYFYENFIVLFEGIFVYAN